VLICTDIKSPTCSKYLLVFNFTFEILFEVLKYSKSLFVTQDEKEKSSTKSSTENFDFTKKNLFMKLRFFT
jgi:hypothetical protein